MANLYKSQSYKELEQKIQIELSKPVLHGLTLCDTLRQINHENNHNNDKLGMIFQQAKILNGDLVEKKETCKRGYHFKGKDFDEEQKVLIKVQIEELHNVKEFEELPSILKNLLQLHNIKPTETLEKAIWMTIRMCRRNGQI